MTLPFSFPFYDGNYDTVQVSSEGFLQFAGSGYAGDGENSAAKLVIDRRIAPLWENLRTNGTGDDIFVDTSIAGQVTIRWDATNEADDSDVNVAVVLFSDGHFRFDYGPGNSTLTPTIGISMGNGSVYRLSSYDGQATLSSASSIEFTLQPSYVDIGAFEFQGSSLETALGQVTDTTPSTVDTGTLGNDVIEQITFTFSKSLDPTDASAPAAYRLIQDTNRDGLFGNGNDLRFDVLPQYVSATRSVVLLIGAGILPDGQYQLTMFGDSIHDTSGLPLDGGEWHKWQHLHQGIRDRHRRAHGRYRSRSTQSEPAGRPADDHV